MTPRAQHDLAESCRIAGKPDLLVDLFCGRKTEADVRAALGEMPAPAKPRAAAQYAPSDGHVLCPTCGGAGEIVDPDADDAGDNAQGAAAVKSWDRAFTSVHGTAAARR